MINWVRNAYFAFYSLIPLMRIIAKFGTRCDCRRTYYKTTLLLSFGFFHFVFLQSADTQSLIYTKEVINVNVLFRIIFDFTDSMINLIKFYFFFFNIFIFVRQFYYTSRFRSWKPIYLSLKIRGFSEKIRSFELLSERISRKTLHK